LTSRTSASSLRSVLPAQAPAPARIRSRTPTRSKPGDTLSGIAAKFGTPGGWQAIYNLNRDLIGPDPDQISPGQVLKLP
jgi:nucleoid-associated protein YgaU